MKPLIGIAAHQALVPLGELETRHEVVAVPYVKSVRKAGGIPILLPVVEPDEAADLLARVDGLVLTGGADVDPANYGAARHELTVDIDPERDARDIAIARAAVARAMPTLAICRGSQVLNVALGGTLVQHIDSHFDVERYNEPVHDVSVDPESALAKWIGLTELGVNTLHHQANATVSGDVKIVAQAPDGTIEGIEVDGLPIVGVQWHPEMMRHRAEHLALFESVVRLAAEKYPG
jgi:putative glutamine amidotransferase